MKRILVIVVSAVCCFAAAAQVKEAETARKFLASKGKDVINLETKYETQAVKVLSDRYGRSFAFVASSSYSKYLDSPILAYSTEASIEGGDYGVIKAIADRYDASLKAIKKTRKAYVPIRPEGKSMVAPLLSRFDFGQSDPFNSMFPMFGRDKCIVGCGPVALGMVMSYYEWPYSGEGEGSLTAPDGSVTTVNLEDSKLSYDGSAEDHALLMYLSAASLKAKVSPGATSSTLSNFVSTLIGHWSYSPACTRVHDTSDINLLQLAYDELDCGRPLVVADSGTHTYVCDGYEDDYLHLDFGWFSYCRGYYRAIVTDSASGKLPFTEMITGIQPWTGQGDLSATVTMSEPGKLDSLLTDQRDFVTSLRVEGPIDGDDIATIRRMAGAVTDYRDGHGMLMHLDLSKANIVGGKPYHTRPAGNMKISGTRTRDGQTFNYNYDMSKISAKDWQTILDWGLERNSSRLLSLGDDGIYYITFFAENDILGKYIFEDCENLLTVSLPESAKEVRSYTFLNCRALRTVENIPTNRDPNTLKGSALE